MSNACSLFARHASNVVRNSSSYNSKITVNKTNILYFRTFVGTLLGSRRECLARHKSFFGSNILFFSYSFRIARSWAHTHILRLPCCKTFSLLYMHCRSFNAALPFATNRCSWIMLREFFRFTLCWSCGTTVCLVSAGNFCAKIKFNFLFHARRC